MKHNPFSVRKQTGKKTATVAAGPIGNSMPSAKLVLADTIYYQVDKGGDYVQEQGG